MIDKSQILRIAEENNLDEVFVELYIEEIERIFKEKFCFTEKDIEKHINKIFRTQNEKAIEYFFEVFTKYSKLDASSKNLTDREKFFRKKFSLDMIEKAFQLYTVQGKKIKDEFFNALREAEAYGIDPYRISNKTTFKNLSVKSFRESLKALMEETYVDTNTMKEFKLFENTEDVKGIFEECSSMACKFNSTSIQNVLELLSNFTYDKENKVFYANVNYVNMVRKCKKILTQTPAQLATTMNFLTKYFTDENDPTTKQELIMKVNQDPTILLLSPDKVFSLEKKLISIGFPEEKVKEFCFNKDNLIQINGISNENISDLDTLKEVLSHYLDKDSVFNAMTKFEYINTKPVVLDIIFKRAIEEGMFSKFLQRPSVLSMITTDNNFGGTRGPKTTKRTGDEKLNPLEIKECLTDKEKSDLQALISKISAKDKEYVESVIENLKGKERKDPNIEPGKHGGTSTTKPKGQRRSKYIDDDLIKRISFIESNENNSDIFKAFAITELCLDKIYGQGYCKKTFASDEIRRNLERVQEIKTKSKNVFDANFYSSFKKVVDHLRHLINDDVSMLKTRNDIMCFALPNDFVKAFKTASKYADEVEQIANLSIRIGNYNDKILQTIARNKNPKITNSMCVYGHIVFNEAYLNNFIMQMITALKSSMKKSTDLVLKPELVSAVSEAKLEPFSTFSQYIYNQFSKMVAKAENDVIDKAEILNHTDIKDVNEKMLSRQNLRSLDSIQESVNRDEVILRCLEHMRTRKTGMHKLDALLNNIVNKISSVEYDDKGIYIRHKNNFTFFYPDAPCKDTIETFKLLPATEGTKSLPKITMTQDKVFDNIRSFDDKLFS